MHSEERGGASRPGASLARNRDVLDALFYSPQPLPEEDSMPRAMRTFTIAVSLLTAIAGAPRSASACSNPFPPNVGTSLTITPTGFQLMIFGGTAFGSLVGAGCGCAVGLPLSIGAKLGCNISGASIVDGGGNQIGTFTPNGTTASSFATYFSPALDPATFNVVGFAGNLTQALSEGESIKITIDVTCTDPTNPALRKILAKFLAHSAVLATGPVMPDGSVEIGDPGHLGVTTVSVNDKCQPAKKKCVAKKQDCLFKLHSLAELQGTDTTTDPRFVAGVVKCQVKFQDSLKGCIPKAEAKGGCIRTGQSGDLEASTDAFVLDVVTDLDPGFPAPVVNTCSSFKKRCVAKKATGLLKCLATAEKKAVPVDPLCTQKVMDKFDACFTKADTVLAPCFVAGDALAIEAKVDTWINDVDCLIDPTTCP